MSKTNGDFNAVLISGIPSTLLEEGRSILRAELKKRLQSDIKHFWVYSEKRLVVVETYSAESVNRIVQVHISIQWNTHELPDCIHIISCSGFTVHCKVIVLTVTQYHSSLLMTLFNM